ncbi:MAG: haloacid dehalogenase, partial [Armatimonadetes bacterium]|nr:haloacid dehalogenase [Armatimonadota bacterium]
MSSVALAPPHLLHAMPGRMRVHLPGWVGQDSRAIETQLRALENVEGAQANPLTKNILIRFDAAATDAIALLTAVTATLQDLLQNATGASESGSAEAAPSAERVPAPPRPSAVREGQGANEDTARARIAVPGLDRDPNLARRVVERLQSRPEVVRASASPLTGRVLVEWNRHKARLEDLVDEIFDLGLPDLPGESLPTHPLDTAPLVQSATRTVGASLGLGLLGARRLLGLRNPPVTSLLPVEAAGLLGIL